MKSILLSLALVSTSALAGVEAMVAQCEAVMRCDVCRVANDPKSYPNGRELLIKGGIKRWVSSADYNYIADAGKVRLPDGRFLMCARVEEAMKKPDSGPALAARALFDAEWKAREYCAVPAK